MVAPQAARDPRVLTLNKLATMPERELEAWLRCERAEVHSSPPSSPTFSLKSSHAEMAGFGHRSGRKIGKLLKRGDYTEESDFAPSPSPSNLKESRQMTVHLCKRHLTYHFSRAHLRDDICNPNRFAPDARLESSPAASADKA